MKSFTKTSKVFLKGILLTVFIICSINPVFAQSAFNRNDNYDFRGLHHLAAGGSHPDNFNIFIESDSDFRTFKLHIKKSRLNLWTWGANKYRIDMNNDGTWELGWTWDAEKTISYTYPNPPNGISANHVIKVEIEYYHFAHGNKIRTKTKQITVFSTPRVYVDSDNNSFIQLRNEDATSKIPVLMVEGFDPVNEKFPEVYYNLTWELINSDLYPNNYEVFILNFNNGGRDLSLNANVLIKALEKVHEICPNYKIALAGLSMGGPIGRYALAKKEDEGGTHHVGLFLSYDSPQDGAHVNPDLQDWIRIQNPNEGAIGELQANLQSIAAKQMLRYNTYDPDKTYFTAFYNEMKGYNGDGYPHQSYNVSVSNGNLEATYGYDQIGRHFMTLKVNDILIKDVPAVPMDCATGSMITDITTKRYGDIFNNPFIHIYYELEIFYNPSYQPTWSALDLVNWNEDPFGNITSYDYSKFDDFVVQTNALQHHELSEVTRNAIMGWLNKNSNVTINYNLPEGGSVTPDNYQVRILHPIQITIPPKTVNVNGKLITYHFVKWEDGNTSNPRTFYTSHDVSLNAIMKGTTLSDDPYAYSNTSQRKFVRTDDGWLLSTYSSMGRIWFESSSDNGTTWKIANNDNKPVDDGEAKLPSICNLLYNYEGFDNRFAIIVYQEKFDNGFKIKAKCYKRWDDQIVYVYQNEVTLASYTSESYSNNANPVLAVDSDRYITFVWEQKSGTAAGLYRRNGRCNIDGLTSTGSNTKLNYTNSSSLNPAITISTDMQRHIVWQSPGIINSTDILYGKTTMTDNFSQQPTNISNGNGYPSNYSPCISLANGKPVVSWTGYYDGNIWKITGEQEVLNRKRALVKVRATNGWPSVCTELGDNVNYVNNNSVTSASEKTVFVLSQGTTPQSKWVKRTSGAYSNICNLSHSGIESQVTTGTDFNNMTAMVFNKQILPFYFIKSTTNFSVECAAGVELNKITFSDSIISYGRSGIISKNGIEFVFNTGDVFIADSSVRFTFVPDTLMFNSAEELNIASRTEDFWLEEGVDFFFSNLYYVIRQELADSLLTEQDQVNFKVELVKVQSGDVVGTFDNITYNKNNLEKYASIHYLVNTSGIQAGEYYLRLVTTVAGDAAYNLSNIQRNEFDLNKLNYVNVSFKGETMPVTYELSQNYPNPFNPTTTIRYQLPKDGMVTLKVYDILGAEVATLVNEEKVAGRYEVSFNASGHSGNVRNLASGVYIYRLNVNDFVNVKKMVMLK